MILKQATVECNPMINRRTRRKAAVIYEDEIEVVLTRIEELEAFEEKYRHIVDLHNNLKEKFKII